MSLKRRLIISNAAIIIIPVLITIVASFAFMTVYSRIFDTDISFENVKKITNIEYEFFKADGNMFQNKPEQLLDKEFQQYLVARLSKINAEIIILKNHDTVFSSKSFNQIDVEKSLDAGKGNSLRSSVKLSGIIYIVKSIDFKFTDGKQGNVILLSPVSNEGIATEKLIFFVLIVFLVSFLMANAVFSLTFSRSILNPLTRLKEAAGEISRGNLTYEVIEEGDGEINDLCRSFEQMRLKLKESVHTQMKYDDNRKMLVSSISHDLKTPITSIKGYVEGILDGVAGTPEKVDKYLKTIYSKASQVDLMIDDLLLYSKLDLKQIPFNFEKTDMVKYFQDCTAEIEPELEKKSIRIQLVNELKECRFSRIDRERVRRVIINIIDNTVKYMNKPDGNLVITLRENDQNIIAQLKDNGAGISKEDLPFIFDRFYRADAARSKKSGSGLGLAIAKQIIEGHDGNIWVRSVENEGTSIMISFKKEL